MILTLKDSSILDEKRGALNEEEDEPERPRRREQAPRRRGRRRPKPEVQPFGADDEAGEDAATVLGKYDDAKEDEGLTLDDRGAVRREERRKAETRRRLAATLGGSRGRGGGERGDEAEPRGFHDRGRAAAEKEKAGGSRRRRSGGRSSGRRRRPVRAGGRARAGGVRAREATRRGAWPPARWKRATRPRGEGREVAAALNKAKLKTDEKILAEMAGEGVCVEDDEGDEDDELRRAERSRRWRCGRARADAAADALASVAARRARDGAASGSAPGVDVGVAFTDAEGFPAATGDDGGAGVVSATGASSREASPPPARAKAFRSRTLGGDGDGRMAGRGRPLTTTICLRRRLRRLRLRGVRRRDGSRRGRGGGGRGGAERPRRGRRGLSRVEGSRGDARSSQEHREARGDGDVGRRTNDKKPLALMRAKEATRCLRGV